MTKTDRYFFTFENRKYIDDFPVILGNRQHLAINAGELQELFSLSKLIIDQKRLSITQSH